MSVGAADGEAKGEAGGVEYDALVEAAEPVRPEVAVDVAEPEPNGPSATKPQTTRTAARANANRAATRLRS
jgi:hypothetical protein